MPAAGEYTRTVILVFVALNGMMPTVRLGPVDTTVPANVSAVAERLTRTVVLAALVGSGCNDESSAPPKPVSV